MIIRTEQDKLKLIAQISRMKLDNPRRVTIEIVDERTIEQNRQQWPYLTAFSEQMTWPVAGEQAHISADDFKDILTASYKGEMLRMAPTLEGDRMVALGLRTSKIPEQEWPNWMAYLKWAAAEYGIKVPMSKKKIAMYEDI